MGEEIAFGNGRISDFEGLGPWPWPWIGSYCTRHASLIDLCLHTKFRWNRRKFLWTDGRTDGWTYGQADRHLRPALLVRFGGVDLIKTPHTTHPWLLLLLQRSIIRVSCGICLINWCISLHSNSLFLLHWCSHNNFTICLKESWLYTTKTALQLSILCCRQTIVTTSVTDTAAAEFTVND